MSLDGRNQPMTAIKPFAERGLAEEMFRLAVEACPNGMMMIDHNGPIVMVNTEIEHQFGYTRDELIGQPIEILVPERLRVGILASPPFHATTRAPHRDRSRAVRTAEGR